MRLVIATRSADKLREIREILPSFPELIVTDLDGAGIEPHPDEEGIEIYDTFRENALAKARYYSRRAGAPVLADDSGICVDAIGGAPGVRSKRYAARPGLSGRALDEANNTRLLEALREVPDALRTAHYVCSVALVGLPEGDEIVVEERCDGTILHAPRGTGGFGYDPLFWAPPEDATFGELAPQRKNQLSHRGRAVRAAGELLRTRLGHASDRGSSFPGDRGAEPAAR